MKPDSRGQKKYGPRISVFELTLRHKRWGFGRRKENSRDDKDKELELKKNWDMQRYRYLGMTHF